MKRFACLLVLLCVCFVAAPVSACDVAVAGFCNAPVAFAAVPVQTFAVQGYAVPSVAVFATPVVVQQQVVVRQKNVRVRTRSRTVTRVR